MPVTTLTSAEDALVSKLEWAKLTESERQLEDAAGIVSIQGDEFDTDYIEKWATTLDLKTQWQKVKTLAECRA